MSLLSKFIRLCIRWYWLLLLLIGIAIYSCFHLFLSGLGMGHDLDVGSMLQHFVLEPSHGETIAESQVSFVPKSVLWLGNIENPEINECSGIAISQVHDDLLWAHNDSGNKPRLYAMNFKGQHLGYVDIEVAATGDWEDMATFILKGEAYLLIADTGDNFRWRPELYLHVTKEPTLQQLQVQEIIPVAWTVTYRYPDNYRDSEAIAVDVDEELVYLLSKRRVPAEVFTVPLRTDAAIVTALRLADLRNIPQPNQMDLLEDPEFGHHRSRPTAMDIQGQTAVVVTYQDAYLFRRRLGQSWADAFAAIPARMALPGTPGREAAALDRSARQLVITGERKDNYPVALFQVEL